MLCVCPVHVHSNFELERRTAKHGAEIGVGNALFCTIATIASHPRKMHARCERSRQQTRLINTKNSSTTERVKMTHERGRTSADLGRSNWTSWSSVCAERHAQSRCIVRGARKSRHFIVTRRARFAQSSFARDAILRRGCGKSGERRVGSFGARVCIAESGHAIRGLAKNLNGDGSVCA